MIQQLDNKIISSFLLYLDHEIQSKGQAFKNSVLSFYPVSSPYSNIYTYTARTKPFCNDTSISGASILSGVYLNNTFIQVGQSGLKAINHYQGALHFTGTNPTNVSISGQLAIKEISIKISNQPDYKLLFETHYMSDNSNPSAMLSGIPLDAEVSPIIFLKRQKQENKPFGFSRLDNQTINMRAIIVVDNEFQEIALTSILKNLNYRAIPLIASTPFDAMGNMTGVTNYNYSQLPIDTSFTPMIFGVKVIDFPITDGVKNILRNMAVIDFEISTIGRST